jgi:predicted kinase
MPKKGTFVKEVRSEWYDLKQTLLKTGYGHLPEDIREKAIAVVNRQKTHWDNGMGILHQAYLTAKAKVLDAQNVSALDRPKYKAFVSEYVSKVVYKKTEDADFVINKFTKLGANPDILRMIISELGEVLPTL